MERVAIVASARTPIGKFLGSFADLSAAELGMVATRGLLERARVAPAEVDELIYGCARQAGGGPNMARQVLIGAGIPKERPAFTVNQACGSGLQSILLAADHIRLGKARVIVAGGAENMTRVPYLLDRARLGYRLGNAPLVDGMYKDGFLDPICGMLMGSREPAPRGSRDPGEALRQGDRPGHGQGKERGGHDLGGRASASGEHAGRSEEASARLPRRGNGARR